MKLFKERDRHAFQIYLVGAAIMILALISGIFRDASPLLRTLCDGTSLSAAAYFLLAYIYRPRGFGFGAVMGFYGRRVRGIVSGDPMVKVRDRQIEEKVDNDFLESMLMLWISLILTTLCFIFYLM